MTPPELPAWSAFKDRKTGLIVFGFFTAVMGGFCALFVPLLFFGQSMTLKAGAPGNMTILPAVVMYAVLAVVLIWLGIGSMLARRWARALLLMFSWSWLIIGLISMCAMGFVLPKIMQTINSAQGMGRPQPPAAFLMLIPMVTIGIIYVVLPAVWVFFYRSRHVKATCEAYDPTVRWTDRAPLPVLAVSLWCTFSALMMLMMAVAYRGVVPMFGTFVVGPVGSAIYVIYGLGLGVAAWAIYKLDLRGWWFVVVSFCLWAISAVITYSRRDVLEIYELMGYSEQQIQEIAKYASLGGPMVIWGTVGMLLPMLGYLIYVRRFFPQKAGRTEPAELAA